MIENALSEPTGGISTKYDYFSNWLLPLIETKFNHLHFRSDPTPQLTEPNTLTTSRTLRKVGEDPAKGPYVIEFEGDIPFHTDSLINTVTDINEMVTRGYTAVAKDSLHDQLLQQAEIAKTDPIIGAIEIKNGKLTYEGSELDISEHVWWDMGNMPVKYSDFIQQIIKNTSNFDPARGINPSITDSMVRLNEEMANMLHVGNEIACMVNWRNTLFLSHFLKKSGLAEKLEQVVKENEDVLEHRTTNKSSSNNLSRKAVDNIKEVLGDYKKGEPHSMDMLFTQVQADYNKRDFKKEDELEKQYGWNYVYFLREISAFHEAARLNNQQLYEKTIWESPGHGDLHPPSFFGNLKQGEHGLKIDFRGFPDQPLDEYIRAFQWVLTSWINLNIPNNLPPDRQNISFSPLQLIIEGPFRANFTLSHMVDKLGRKVRARIAFGNPKSKGSPKDPAKANLVNGFDYI